MRKYGLIGKSLGHSFSKSFFRKFFKENNIDANYSNVEIPLIENVREYLNSDYDGFNVTIPYKEEIIPFLDDVSSIAQEIGAVNVIRNNEGKYIGYNTDAYGFHQSIKPFLTSQHERAIIFGTGGASKAVEYILKSLGVDVIFITRNPIEKNHFSYEEVNENMLNACKLLINCTPVGTYPNVDEVHHIPYSALTSAHLVIDLVYNPVKTLFLQLAEEQGAMILNGEAMLKHQALKSWEIWNSEL